MTQVMRGAGCFLLVLAWPVIVAAQEAAPPAVESTAEADASRAAQFAQFAKQLDNVVLVGNFTIDGSDNLPREERYEIKSVTKIGTGDQWLFQTRIKYGDHDVTLPLPLPVKWAGNTPVITLDSLTIPGLGTFDARVVIDGHRYAGTWQHGEAGGHLFGVIKKNDSEASPK
ncbi:MAG: hypothetical protein KDA60_13960 [Planctomycetales bacterium]|nr:hypothetical protein [Planctomycetales bacterium]